MQRTATPPATTPTSTTPPLPSLSRPPTREARRPSLSAPATRRRASSAAAPVTDAAAPPALPDYALLPAAARVRRDAAADAAVRSPDAAAAAARPPPTTLAFVPPPLPAAPASASEASLMHQHVTDLATKRISTLDYLRKAHEGRVYWFNTYLFDRPDLARMPSLDPRRLARRATNLLLLGLSVPTIGDLYASSALEFLRCLNALLAEFDSFQQLHGDASSASSAALARARLPNILLRLPGAKARRSASAEVFAPADDAPAPAPGPASSPHPQQPLPPHQQQSSSSSVMTFAAAESDLLPGEEYTYLLTPSLPFEPDLYETFATLCDVLIDCYARFLALVPTPRECSAPVADLFAKADAKLRKMIVQAVVKEFDDHSRSHVKSEVASIGKVVLAGLM